LWEYVARGEIADVVPAFGQHGTRVEIRGQRLLGGGDSFASITFAGTAVNIVSANDTFAVVIVQKSKTGAGRGDVVLTSSSGSIVTRKNSFEYLEEGEITLVAPARGQYGTYVSVHGTNLYGGGTSLSSISFGGVDALIVSESSSLIKVRIMEAFELGLGDLSIVSESAAIVALEDGWLYDVPSNITNVCV
jgi:hypothetical protein